MNLDSLRYSPDEWAHDLDQWWAPLAELAGRADCGSDTWLSVLGVDEFFDHRLLGQVHLRTPWLCVAASALAASAARHWGSLASRQDDRAEASARMLAITSFRLAATFQQLRWSGKRLGEGVISTDRLIQVGRLALGGHGLSSGTGGAPDSVSLAAGWLVHSGTDLRGSQISAASARPTWHDDFPPERGAAEIAKAVLRGRRAAGPLAWGTAHLVERLAGGTLDTLAGPCKPDDPPAHGWANILLISDHGEVGLFEARRQRSLVTSPVGMAVPDLARLAFTHATPDCLGSIEDAFAAAHTVEPLERPGELISWNLQPRHGSHPLAERTVSGRSASLGAYVAFRSLGNLRIFADRQVAFTGQVSPDGGIGRVEGASWKIWAASEQGIRLVVHPMGQAWLDPGGTVLLEAVERAEDAVIAAAQPLRGLRRYLEAACGLVEPEPWLQTWLNKQGGHELEMPLLDVMCRHLHPPRGSAADHDLPSGAAGAPLPDPITGRGVPPGVEQVEEPEIAPCPAHLLARTYPGVSFVISAAAGCGNTVAAKRMVAEAARQAIESLRAIRSPERAPTFTVPLYVPLGEMPSSWDSLIQAGVGALPELAESSLDISAALASALGGDDQRSWRALVVVDGTDRTRRADRDSDLDKERDFVALITGSPGHSRRGWRPSQPPQVVLCGRYGSPAHQKAAEALRSERPYAVATIGLDPLTGPEIDRFVTSLSGGSLSLVGRARDLAANPLLLAISIIAGHPQAGDSGPVDLFHRAINVLLAHRSEHRRLLAEIAFRAASAKREPVGEFTVADIAGEQSKEAVEAALASKDAQRALALALDLDERRAFQSAEEDTHLLTASSDGWRFFHDRAFAFLVADRIARHAIEEPGTDDDHFGVLGPHLGDPFWADVIEAIGRLLELYGQAADSPAPG